MSRWMVAWPSSCSVVRFWMLGFFGVEVVGSSFLQVGFLWVRPAGVP